MPAESDAAQTRRTSDAVGVDVAHRDEVVLRVEVAPVGHRERLVRDGVVDRTPHVDEAHAALEQALGVFSEVVVHPLHGRVERLVYVDPLL